MYQILGMCVCVQTILEQTEPIYQLRLNTILHKPEKKTVKRMCCVINNTLRSISNYRNNEFKFGTWKLTLNLFFGGKHTMCPLIEPNCLLLLLLKRIVVVQGQTILASCCCCCCCCSLVIFDQNGYLLLPSRLCTSLVDVKKQRVIMMNNGTIKLKGVCVLGYRLGEKKVTQWTVQRNLPPIVDYSIYMIYDLYDMI